MAMCQVSLLSSCFISNKHLPIYVSDSEVNGKQAVHLPPTGIQCSHRRQLITEPLPQLSNETGIQMYTCGVAAVCVCVHAQACLSLILMQVDSRSDGRVCKNKEINE